MAKNNNIFLTKGTTLEALKGALPKVSVSTGFVVNTANKVIEYQGHPKTLKYNVPKMVAIVESFDNKEGFKVIRTPKQYMKDGVVKTTHITTFSYTDEAKANILVENVNKLIKADYEEWKATSKK